MAVGVEALDSSALLETCCEVYLRMDCFNINRGVESTVLSIGGIVVQENWLEKIGPLIQSRIERYAQNEIRFNLMAVIRNRTDVLEEELASLEARRAALSSSKGAVCGTPS